MTKEYLIASAILFALGFAFTFWGTRLTRLNSESDFYGWPAVTKCPSCGETIWAWQRYDRRESKAGPLVEGKGSIIYATATCSQLFHTGCEGTPTPPKITITVGENDG